MLYLPRYSVKLHGDLLVIVGISYGIGKLISGFTVPRLPSRPYLFVLTLGSSTCVFLASFINDFTDDPDTKFSLLSVFMSFNALFQSQAFPASVQYCSIRFREEQLGRVFSFVGVGSRIGSVATSVVIGALLSVMHWPSVVRLTALCTLLGIPVLALTYASACHSKIKENGGTKMSDPKPDRRQTSAEENSESKCESGQVPARKTGCRQYATWWCDGRFLLMVLGTGCLGVMSTFDSFVALWLKIVFGASTSVSAVLGGAAALGIVLSITVGGYFIERMHGRGSGNAVVLMLMFLVLVVAALTTMTGVAESADACFGDSPSACIAPAGLLIVLYGFCLGYPYYVPPTVFAVAFAGGDSAMVLCFMDIFSAALGAGVAQASGALSETGWIYVWLLMLGISISGSAFFTCYHFVNLKWKKKLEAKKQASVKSLLVSEPDDSAYKTELTNVESKNAGTLELASIQSADH